MAMSVTRASPAYQIGEETRWMACVLQLDDGCRLRFMTRPQLLCIPLDEQTSWPLDPKLCDTEMFKVARIFFGAKIVSRA